jgi:hypothetical protein
MVLAYDDLATFDRDRASAGLDRLLFNVPYD